MNGDAVSGLITIMAMLTIIITFVIKERNSEVHKRLKEFKFSEENKNLECKEYEEEIKKLKEIFEYSGKMFDDLYAINQKQEVENIKIKQTFLLEKGYRGMFTSRYTQVEISLINLDYYIVDICTLSVTKENGTLNEVYELDQKGKIFPTRELAEKSLLAKIEKEEQAKEELKKKYNEDREEENTTIFISSSFTPIISKQSSEEEIDFSSMSQDQMRMFLEERYGYCNGLGGIQIIKGSEFLKIKKETK